MHGGHVANRGVKGWRDIQNIYSYHTGISMASTLDEHGYDLEFVEPPPAYLECVVCHHILRNPVQIMQCGHRYCQLCFERIKGYSERCKSDLCCPVDRKEIDITQVFMDTGMARIISDLIVKCTNHNLGCLWTGELRNVKEHKKQCSHSANEMSMSMHLEGCSEKEVNLLLKEMCRRLDKYEDMMLKKEKDLSHVKFKLEGMKECVNNQDKEINALKSKNTEMVKEIDLLKSNQEEIHNLKTKIKTMRETEDMQNEKIQGLKTEVKELNDKLVESRNKSQASNTQESINKAVEKSLKTTDEKLNEVKHDLRSMPTVIDLSLLDFKTEMKDWSSKSEKLLKGEMIKLKHESFQRINELVAHVSKNEKSTSDVVNKTKGVVFEKLNELITHVNTNEKSLNGEVNEIRKLVLKNINELGTQVNHADGFLSYDNHIFLKSTTFVWIIHNFEEHFDARKELTSPKFYCQPYGHLCQLFTRFRDESENMGLFFRLVKGKNHDNTAKFDLNILCELLHNNGSRRALLCSSEDVVTNRERFTFKGNCDVTPGLGFHDVFEKNEMGKYITGNRCTVLCTLTPHN